MPRKTMSGSEKDAALGRKAPRTAARKAAHVAENTARSKANAAKVAEFGLTLRLVEPPTPRKPYRQRPSQALRSYRRAQVAI